ncbi:MAG: hypothetical protein K2X08_08090 [Chlamydiales bacterium]|nr:hypothetical protein [Chlamydiales bacterium]
MTVTLVSVNVDYPKTTSSSLTQIFGSDDVRRRIKPELLALGDELSRSHLKNNLHVQNIGIWHDSFLKALSHPDPQWVIEKYIQELVRLLRDPATDPQTPFPVEFFSNQQIPVIRYVTEKMRDRNSLFYSKQFDLEALEVLAPLHSEQENKNQEKLREMDGDIPEKLLAQLRQIEKNIAFHVHIESRESAKIQALSKRVQEEETKLLANIDRVARQQIDQRKSIEEGIERLQLRDLEQRAFFKAAAERLRQNAENLRVDTAKLQSQLHQSSAQLSELERANIQLQIELNQARERIETNQSDWLLTIAIVCVAVVS